MAPLTRAKASSSRVAPILIQRDSDDSDHYHSSSSDYDDEEQVGAGDSSDDEDMGTNGLPTSEELHHEPPNTTSNAPPRITISLKKVCKVCKGTGHEAGFRGATYIDCPRKPCYLCKMPGHTTMSCPHRVAMEHGVVPAPRRNTSTTLDYIFQRQLNPNIPMIKPTFVIPDQLTCGIIRFHSRRVTCLEFHPTKNSVLLSGDKKGQVGIWDYSKLHEKTVYNSIHTCIVNNIKFNTDNDGTMYASSSDGTVSCTDLETGVPFVLLDLNPNGWIGPAAWRMVYGMDINTEKGLVLVADNFGRLYFLDTRSRTRAGGPFLIHKKGTKVVGLHCNPVEPGLLLSCGNDHFARIWDIRRLEAGSSLDNLRHGRVVNSAYFSPRTGSKILTTSIDNRIRVWDSIFTNMESPSREIVHSQDFNRHLTPFRAEWDPKDPSESLAVVGRYISENYDGVALHPIDFIDTTSGKLVAEVIEPDITTISPVNKLHPRDDVLATGSSRSLFIWRPKEDIERMQEQLGKKAKEFIIRMGDKKSKGKGSIDSDDDSDLGFKGKTSKTKKYEKSYTSGKSKKSKGVC
ncbi:DNA damage-binding protein 2 [Dioscorea alata]|uniref:DNA damage-binding protein 2 n=1 Tax=Dioscorea alata TaxID=55571 RepID=A0ACB7VGX4_DIOAL|nr:DNA damage-binding protein 2 [Dioscorea alata]